MCGTPPDPGAAFCEACGADLGPGTTTATRAPEQPVLGAATPNTAAAGEESPLDVGWTGPVQQVAPNVPTEQRCTTCGEGQIVDGYCDTCGTKPPDPRNHMAQTPQPWVAGVCDIGRRHHRNEDAMSLAAWGGGSGAADARAVLVACDGVTMATDSHIASLAAAQAASAHLSQPLPQGAGTPEAWAAAASRALTQAVDSANRAVVASVPESVPEPPSCTFVAAVIEGGQAVVGNVGDSRAYWLPDDEAAQARQLGRDDSFAQEQIEAGVERKQAEEGDQAHAITRWLGRDAPEDLTPHLTTLPLSADGWLLLCTDGLWNYVSDAAELGTLVRRLGAERGSAPAELADALVGWANEQGGRDNITVVLARVGAVAEPRPAPEPAPAAPVAEPVPAPAAPVAEPAVPVAEPVQPVQPDPPVEADAATGPLTAAQTEGTRETEAGTAASGATPEAESTDDPPGPARPGA